MTSISED